MKVIYVILATSGWVWLAVAWVWLWLRLRSLRQQQTLPTTAVIDNHGD